ncbi:osteoglycin, paralog b isoform X1 [Conger conger]|uniref:osteoglycin, paralog b isoform X1 n=1 Tax=Conger conger TaxID=82655 RepID=UPI002A5B0048|nr:osteoglycin, paralog b isoform X1 [Conger conger]
MWWCVLGVCLACGGGVCLACGCVCLACAWRVVVCAWHVFGMCVWRVLGVWWGVLGVWWCVVGVCLACGGVCLACVWRVCVACAWRVVGCAWHVFGVCVWCVIGVWWGVLGVWWGVLGMCLACVCGVCLACGGVCLACGGISELPTCLLCVCLTGSVYCEEVLPDMTAVPPLPKETSYLYARYNHIAKIGNADFADSPTLKRIDLTGNMISEIEDGAFSKLLLLEELALAENRLVRLPMLPPALTTFNANHNQLRTKGLKANAFKKLTKLAYLYLGDNQLEAVPHLPESLRVVHLQNNNITAITDMTFCKGNTTRYLRTKMDVVRLDGNPVGLGVYPNSFICLRTLPIGRYY